MRNLMLFVAEDRSRDLTPVRRNLDLQVANSLELGWAVDDLWLYTNFPYEHGEVRAQVVEPPRRPRTARATSFYKTWCILQALDRLGADEYVWYHDVDAYQLVPFDQPPTDRPLAFCLYTTRERLLVQGGSQFFTRAARPVFEGVLARLEAGVRKDEYALTDLVGEPEFLDFFDVLDFSYNLGDTDFALRYQLASKPIKVVHFHPDRQAHRATFLDGCNTLGVRPLPERFVSLLHRSGVLAGSPAPRRRRGWWFSRRRLG